MTNLILGTALAFFQQAAPTLARETQERTIETGGWVFMVSAWAFILVLVFYTFGKVLRGEKK